MCIMGSLRELQPKHPDICNQAQRISLELLEPSEMTVIFDITYQAPVSSHSQGEKSSFY